MLHMDVGMAWMASPVGLSYEKGEDMCIQARDMGRGVLVPWGRVTNPAHLPTVPEGRLPAVLGL